MGEGPGLCGLVKVLLVTADENRLEQANLLPTSSDRLSRLYDLVKLKRRTFRHAGYKNGAGTNPEGPASGKNGSDAQSLSDS